MAAAAPPNVFIISFPPRRCGSYGRRAPLSLFRSLSLVFAQNTLGFEGSPAVPRRRRATLIFLFLFFFFFLASCMCLTPGAHLTSLLLLTCVYAIRGFTLQTKFHGFGCKNEKIEMTVFVLSDIFARSCQKEVPVVGPSLYASVLLRGQPCFDLLQAPPPIFCSNCKMLSKRNVQFHIFNGKLWFLLHPDWQCSIMLCIMWQ